MIVPRTLDRKSCFCELIRVEFVQKPTFFVSHRWGCQFSFLFGCIEKFMKARSDLDEESTFFWLDIFAINQHPGATQHADLGQLKNAIALSNKTLLCLDPQGKIKRTIRQAIEFVFCVVFY